MRQIDDAHDAKNQRQAAADEKQQRAIGYAIERLDQPKLSVHVPPSETAGSCRPGVLRRETSTALGTARLVLELLVIAI